MYYSINNSLYIMKMKLYYGVLALVWLLSGCNLQPSEDVVGITWSKQLIKEMIISKHTYLVTYHSVSHSGECKQCKYELDSIIKNAVNEAITTKIWKAK